MFFNHATYRLVFSRVFQEFADSKEVNIFLREMIPFVGFKSTGVYVWRMSLKEAQVRFEVPFFIWTNCEIVKN